MQLRYPRCIHSEFMTHRAFSRNASSSRAVPVQRLIQDVLDDPFVPLFWGKNQKGMQAGEECKGLVWADGARPQLVSRDMAWLRAMGQAVETARSFDAAGYHKQIVNRLLEPFSHINVVVSSTTWDNFFALRDHPDAEPHIQLLARAMKQALAESTPQSLERGWWHLPYITDEDWDRGLYLHGYVQKMIRVSVARCASVSYKTVEGEPMTIERANALCEKLLGSNPVHASPAEHVAQVDTPIGVGWLHPEQHRNFTGFRQYRAMVGA